MDYENARQVDALGDEERFRYRELPPIEPAQRNRLSRTAANGEFISDHLIVPPLLIYRIT